MTSWKHLFAPDLTTRLVGILAGDTPIGHDDLMGAQQALTRTSLQQRLSAHARAQWPQLADVTVQFRGAFAYVDGQLPDGDTRPLMRLRYGVSAARGASRCTGQ